MKIETFLKWLSADICAFFALLWGDLDGLMTALLIAMGLDFVTGLIVGASQRNLRSSICYRGLARKMLILAMVALGNLLDRFVFGGGGSVCRSGVIGFYFANEGLSIVENAGLLGLPLPKKLRQWLAQLRDENDEDDDKEDKKNGK